MSDWAMPDSICPAETIRRFSTEPCVACVTATRPGTPQLPPCSHGGEPVGFEIALAITPPISKKVPEVAAAPMRKNCPSCALDDVPPGRRQRIKIAAARGPHHHTPNLVGIVSPVRQQFRKTTWITLDCNSVTRPAVVRHGVGRRWYPSQVARQRHHRAGGPCSQRPRR